MKSDKNNKENFNNTNEELGSLAKELLKPENLIGPFETTEEMLKSLWDED